MTEQNLIKAIKVKEGLDYYRRLLEFAMKPSVELSVQLFENEVNGEVFTMNRVLGEEGFAEIKEKIITNIKDKIHSLESQIEKLLRMTEMEEIKLAAYNSYKRHMRVFGKGKEILSFAEWEKKACEQLK